MPRVNAAANRTVRSDRRLSNYLFANYNYNYNYNLQLQLQFTITICQTLRDAQPLRGPLSEL